MSVLLPNVSLGLRRRVEGVENSHGEAMAEGWAPYAGPYPGRANETADGTWRLGLDPALWPVRVGDLVIATTGASWLVQSSDLIQNAYDPYVDWVRVTGLHRTEGGTEPGGAWFVARYADMDEVVAAAAVWTGHGPPPEDLPGAKPGDEYIDLDSGYVYQLGE